MIKKILLIVIVAGAFRSACALTPAEQAEMIAAHNKWRQEAGVADVTWSADLAATAQAWADTLKRTRGCKMTHSGAEDLGENLYSATPRTWSDGTKELQAITATRVTDAWGSEKQYYDHAGNTCAGGKVCGHYTQLVWKTTTQLGCAKAVCEDNSQVWVCNYAPPGNYRGQRPF